MGDGAIERGARVEPASVLATSRSYPHVDTPSVARGAEAIVYFRFRAADFGTEEFCHGIIDHDGKPKRMFKEVQHVMSELLAHGDMINAAAYKSDVRRLF